MRPEPRYRATAVFSRGIKIPHLGAFVPETERLIAARRRLPRCVDSIAWWAATPAAERARQLAERHGLAHFVLDRGFIHPLAAAGSGAAPVSLIVDPVGIHYDATRPSALENLLESRDSVLPINDAIGALAQVRAERLSTHSAARDLAPGELDTGHRPLIVVADQTRGDPSVDLGLGSERQFLDMLDAALDEHPDAAILIKPDPEEIAGRAQGYLAERARQLGIAVLDRDVNPLSLVERAERVYTVTSQVGVEAMICGTPVTCFGMPFYAGWGASDDRVACSRRTLRRSILEIFAAAYLCYARYVDPLTGQPADLKRVLERLTVMKRANERHRGHNEGLGFDRRQRRMVRRFFHGAAVSLAFSAGVHGALERARQKRGRVCVWTAREPADLMAAARQIGAPVVRVEAGFIGSPGAGAGRAPLTSLVFDRRGIYHDLRGLSELEEILEFETFDDEVLAAAAALRARLLETGLTGRRADHEGPFGFEDDRRHKILVIGLAQDDVPLGPGGVIWNDLDLLGVVRQRWPDALIAYLPHPDQAPRRRWSRAPGNDTSGLADLALRDACPRAAIAAVDEVHTLASLHGFEALLHERKVRTYGSPFYAGWGLTDDRLVFPRRTRRLSIDQLVAGALLLYPSYVDPVSALPCDALTAVDRLGESGRRSAPGPLGLALRRCHAIAAMPARPALPADGAPRTT